MASHIVLYDGVCMFCEGWVNFVIKRASEKSDIYFIPLDFVTLSKDIQENLDNQKGQGDSILCISDEGEYYLKSDASLTIMSLLRAPYGFISKVLLLIPRFIRNFVYDQIGKRRYRIWGKKDYCEIPSGLIKKKFLKNPNEIPASFKGNYNKYFEFKM